MASFLSFLRSLGMLLARLGLGGILLLHGWMRWNGGMKSAYNRPVRGILCNKTSARTKPASGKHPSPHESPPPPGRR